MSQEKAPRFGFEYLNLADFERDEIFGGSPEILRDDPEAFKAYREKRLEYAEQGHPTFIVESFFGAGFRMDYFVEASLMATIWCDKRYFVDTESSDPVQDSNEQAPSAYAMLITAESEEPQEMSLQRAIRTVKEFGYPSLAESA